MECLLCGKKFDGSWNEPICGQCLEEDDWGLCNDDFGMCPHGSTDGEGCDECY